MNVCSPVQLMHRNSKKDSSFKMINENTKEINHISSTYSPMSALNNNVQMNYAFQRMSQQENEVAISDSDTERNRDEMLGKNSKIRQWSVLTPATPQNKLANKDNAFTPKVFLGSERRGSEASANSSHNIFNRRSKAALSRKDSIFTHVSGEVNITCNPSTGERQLNQYILMKIIGKGSFAEVWLGYNILDKQKYAVKIVQLTKLRRIFTVVLCGLF